MEKKLSSVHGLTVLTVKGAVKDGACWNVMPKLFKFFAELCNPLFFFFNCLLTVSFKRGHVTEN